MQDGNDEPRVFFDRLGSEEADELLSLGRRRTYPRGATIFNEGEISDRIVAVVSGQVKISYFTVDGREVVLAIRGAGDLLGELSAMDGQPLSATATAMDTVEVRVVLVDQFKAFLEGHPRAAVALLEMVIQRLRDADRKRIEFAAHDSVGRVALRLVELARRFGESTDSGVKIDLPLSQEELAGWTGSSREAVSKALQHLRSRGWIETGRRSITITDIDALADRAT